MKVIERDILLPVAADMMKKKAMSGCNTGERTIYNQIYFAECRWWLAKFECLAILTRDTGYHTGGWWKNPDYERCWHLSLSFPGGRNKQDIEKILDAVFGEDKKKLWVEPPYSKTGKSLDVWHYRLFYDEQWDPIKPRGEVYSRELTKAGWKSYSELVGEREIKKKKG